MIAATYSALRGRDRKIPADGFHGDVLAWRDDIIDYPEHGFINSDRNIFARLDSAFVVKSR